MGNQEAEKAEIFDALAHPTRITILKLLSHEAASFADLKRKMNIDSSIDRIQSRCSSNIQCRSIDDTYYFCDKP